MATGYANFENPATKLRRRIIDQMDPNATSAAADPVAPIAGSSEPPPAADFAPVGGSGGWWSGEVGGPVQQPAPRQPFEPTPTPPWPGELPRQSPWPEETPPWPGPQEAAAFTPAPDVNELVKARLGAAPAGASNMAGDPDPNIPQGPDNQPPGSTIPGTPGGPPPLPPPPVPEPAPAAAAPPPVTNNASAGDGGGWDQNRVTAYFQSRGVQPFPTSVDYWVGKWNEWGKNDPAYFEKRLAEADEFTGVGPNYDWQKAGKKDPGTSAGGAAPAPAAAAPSAYDAYLQQLMSERAAAAAQKAQVRAMIMARLQAAGTPVDENSLEITAPLGAARDETQRAEARERTALAERLYAQGGGALDTDALKMGIQQSAERNAGGLSQLRAGLISKGYDDKRQELMGLLQMALASGDTESAQLLQAQIANLSATVNREGMGLSFAQFMAQLNQNAALAGLNG